MGQKVPAGSTSASSRMKRSQSKRALARSRTDSSRCCFTEAKEPKAPSAVARCSACWASASALSILPARSLTWFWLKTKVRLEAVMGVLSLYMLIGMAFGFVFGAIDRIDGEPFFAGGEAATVSRCMYFSFTTLTTVGYGDLVARSDLGHTLAVFEALIGQIYLVTVVSLIVGNLGRPARRAREARET
jgi:Ion channel